jgi:hypothetical protein
MDYFYDGQIRRYVTQFMRVFIGFKYKTGGSVPEERHIPVMYGDMTRQVAGIIKDNSENKMSTVPKVACYISGLELDTSRLADPTFISKVQIRERSYEFDNTGDPVYSGSQGGGYTVERLMPTPFKLTMKCDIWTSNTDQKLQILEQILVLFNPSLEIQTTDNYLDWTSLSVIYINNINFSSRTIPQGAESEIDICTLEFEMPVWITPPAKVKRLGIVRSVISNVFSENGDVLNLSDLSFNLGNRGADVSVRRTNDNYSILLLSANNPGLPNLYNLSILDVNQIANVLQIPLTNKFGKDINWETVLEQQGGYIAGLSKIHFLQPSGYEVTGTFTVNALDPNYLSVTIDRDTVPSNTLDALTAIIDPYNFNPKKTFNGISNIPVGTRYLMLDAVNSSVNRGQSGYDGPDAWKNLDSSDPEILENSIIEWNGDEWVTVFTPTEQNENNYVTNLTTGIQYKWDGQQWLKSFEGEYTAGFWRFDLDA